MKTFVMPASRGQFASTHSRKAAAAISGGLLAGWLVLHGLGNLTAFAGASRMDGYAAALRRFGSGLWLVRIGLVAAAIVHIAATLSLARRARAARPVRTMRRFSRANLSSRAAIVLGPLLLLFTGYHLLHLTFGVIHPTFEPGRVYANLVAGLSSPAVALVYGLAAALVGVHLYRGLMSAAASLGVTRATNATARVLSALLAIAVAGAFASVPIAVLSGIVR